MSDHDVPKWFWAGAPLFTLAVMALAPLLSGSAYDNWYLSETGFVELGTVAFLIAAAVLLVRLLRRRRELPRHMAPFALLLLLGAIFFAGEEMDWGQVFFGTEVLPTPGIIEEANREGQFSLHKLDENRLTRVLFNTGPRLAATLVMLFGGLAALGRGRILDHLPERWRQTGAWLLPTLVCAPTFLFAALSTVPAKWIKRVGYDEVPSYLYLALRKPGGEIKEYLIALGILIFVWSLYRRHTPGTDTA